MLPAKAAVFIKKDICVAGAIVQQILDVIYKVICGEIGSALVDIVRIPAICPLTLFGHKCVDALGMDFIIAKEIENA
eukprot:Pgem_evm1s12826